jgi:ATP-dependent DNA helicase RecQ
MKERILQTLTHYWGYTSFRRFQEDAILSILGRQDTLTILPTGGGKSVCFQLPALIADGMAVVISPLISLMKDQVDALKDMGIAAACLNSSLGVTAQRAVIEAVAAGTLKLLYISPERLMMDDTRALLRRARLSFFVVDEAHCISHWGHDFREEYRQLGCIKQEFAGIAVHAFTATATAAVQQDIVAQLRLDAPRVSVGNVDRPNLTYRVLPRGGNVVAQIAEVIDRHPGEPGIVYCLRRADVDEISRKLGALGYENLPYHAGLADAERKRNQEAFSSESVNIIVATIAFGMGVDRSNIRYVVHAAMPKSIEHYQQETGRAGRDGLPADCYLFYSGADYRTWEYMLRDTPERAVYLEKLGAMYNFCVRPECRHRFLVRYFGQEYAGDGCGACDFCLGEVEMVAEPLIVGQKVLSCVARVQERFGAGHIADILQGSRTAVIARWKHDTLSTFGLLKDETKVFIRFMIEQLIGQGFLRRDSGDGPFSRLVITDAGRRLLRGEAVPQLAKPVVPAKKKEIDRKRRAKRAEEWAGVDEQLFEMLRATRAALARDKGVPAYIVFSDKTLRDMALRKPATPEAFAEVFGVGAAKQKEYGAAFTAAIREYLGDRP